MEWWMSGRVDGSDVIWLTRITVAQRIGCELTVSMGGRHNGQLLVHDPLDTSGSLLPPHHNINAHHQYRASGTWRVRKFVHVSSSEFGWADSSGQLTEGRQLFQLLTVRRSHFC